MVIDIVGLQKYAREFRKQISCFVCGPRRANDANRLPAVFVANFSKLLSDHRKGFFPRRRNQLAFFSNKRLREALFVIRKIEGVTAFDAEKVAVRAALVAIVAANDFHAGVGTANAQRGLATIATMSANGSDMRHLPRASLVAIRPGSECADGADVDAHAALFALQVVFFIVSDY